VQGAALGGAAVTVKCATGSGTTTTAASGAYTSTIENAALPCVVKVVGTNGTTYHSLVAGTGNTGTFAANASPLTEMAVSQIAAMDPAAFFTAFSSTSTVSATSVAAANAYLQTALAGLTDLSGVNPLTDTLVVGNALDQQIDAIVAGLTAAGITVADVTTSIVANPTAPSVVASAAAPAATDCAWLKSGTYVGFDRNEPDPKKRFGTFQFDAKTLTATGDANNPGSVTLTSDGACQFSFDESDATHKVIVSSASLIFDLFQSKQVATDRELFVNLPLQTLPIAELAGTWNFAVWVPANIPVPANASNVEVAVDSNGQVTASKVCVGLLPCNVASAPFGKFVANTGGGFDVLDGGGAVVGRSFVYKTIAGNKVAVNLRTDNTLAVGVPMKPIALPAVGTVTQFRSVQLDVINGVESTSPLTQDTVTVTATDGAAKTATRLLSSNSRVDTLTYDKPRDGLRYRAGGSCTINNVPTNPPCAEIVQLRLQGFGMTMTLSAAPKPTNQFYQLTVDKP
jgi:hypothetical protein